MTEKPPHQQPENISHQPCIRDMHRLPDLNRLTDLRRITELNSVALDSLIRSRPSLSRNDGIIPAVRDSLFQLPLYPSHGIGYPDYGLASSAQHSMDSAPRNVPWYQNRQFMLRQYPSFQEPNIQQLPNIREKPISVHFKARSEAGADLRRPKNRFNSVVSGTQMFKIELDVKEYRATDLKVKVKDGWLVVEGKYEALSEVDDFTGRQFWNRFQIPTNVDRSRFSSVLTPEGMLYISAPFVPRKEEIDVPIDVDDGSVDADDVAWQYPAEKND